MIKRYGENYQEKLEERESGNLNVYLTPHRLIAAGS